MEHPDDEVHLPAEDARAGATHHGVRYVLAISMALVILAFILVYMFRPGYE